MVVATSIAAVATSVMALMVVTNSVVKAVTAVRTADVFFDLQKERTKAGSSGLQHLTEGNDPAS